MAALIAYVILFFAPIVGIEPTLLDDEASVRFLLPIWIPISAFAVGGAVEVFTLWMMERRTDPRPWLGVVAALTCSYGAAALLGFVASLVLRSPLVDRLSIREVLVGVGVALTVGVVILGAWGLPLARRRLGLSAESLGSSLRRIALESAASLAAAAVAWVTILSARGGGFA